jgi:hypothetical protein
LPVSASAQFSTMSSLLESQHHNFPPLTSSHPFRRILPRFPRNGVVHTGEKKSPHTEQAMQRGDRGVCRPASTTRFSIARTNSHRAASHRRVAAGADAQTRYRDASLVLRAGRPRRNWWATPRRCGGTVAESRTRALASNRRRADAAARDIAAPVEPRAGPRKIAASAAAASACRSREARLAAALLVAG